MCVHTLVALCHRGKCDLPCADWAGVTSPALTLQVAVKSLLQLEAECRFRKWRRVQASGGWGWGGHLTPRPGFQVHVRRRAHSKQPVQCMSVAVVIVLRLKADVPGRGASTRPLVGSSFPPQYLPCGQLSVLLSAGNLSNQLVPSVSPSALQGRW